MASKSEYELILKLREEISRKSADIDKKLAELDKRMQRLKKKTDQSGKSFGKLRQRIVDLNPAASKMSRVLDDVGLSGGKLTTVLTAGTIGVAALVGGIAVGTRSIIKMGVELTTLRDKTGISLQGLQELNFIADQTNVGMNQVTDAVVRLGRRAAAELPEATKGLDRIGVSVEQLLSMRPAEQFSFIISEIAKLPTEAEQAAVSMAVFGDAGQQILPLIRSDVEGLREEFEQLGGGIEDDVLEAGRKFDDQMTSLKQNVMALTGQALGPLVVKLAEVAEGFVEAQKKGNDLMQGVNTLPEDLRMEALGLIGSGQDPERLQELRAMAKEQQENARLVSSEIARLNSVHNANVKVTNDAADAAEAHAKALKELAKSTVPLFEKFTMGFGMSRNADTISNLLSGGGGFGVSRPDMGHDFSEIRNTTLETLAFTEDIAKWMDTTADQTGRARDAAVDFSMNLQDAHALAELIGGAIGNWVGGIVAATAGVEKMASFDFKNMFKGGFFSDIGAIGGLVGIGASIASPIVKGLAGLFGRDSSDVMKEVGRDMGVSISEGLAESIHQSGQNAQFFIKEIFGEGGMSADQLAQEVQDLFSFHERGEIGLGMLREEFAETMPLLVEHFEEMGAAGRENLDAIITRAQELGINVDELKAKTQGLADFTLEEFRAEFDLTNEQARQVLDDMGINFETNLERMATAVGLPVDQFQKLQEAVEQSLGQALTDEEFLAFMQQTGLSAQQLAENLGVEGVAGEVGTAAAETMAANENTLAAVEATKQWDAALKDVAGTLGGLSFPAIPTGGIPGAAEEAFVPRRPGGSLWRVGEGAENEFILRESTVRGMARGGGGGGDAETKALMRMLIAAVGRLPGDVGRSVRDNVHRGRKG